MTGLEVSYLNRRIPNEELIRLIKEQSFTYREAGQIARRMKDLLPEQLKKLKRLHHKQCKAAAAERKALVDPEYQQSIEEYVNLIEQAQRSRILYETHKMLFQARQSLRGYHLAAAQVARLKSKIP